MLKLENVNVRYPSGVEAVRNVNLSLEEEKIHGIIGPSGGGKSTVLKSILNLVPHTGIVSFRGKPVTDFSKQVAYVQQKEQIDKDFPITVFQCVLLGTYPTLGLFKNPGDKERKLTLQALQNVNLVELKNRQIGELSGGQFQRMLIARAIVQDATLMLLDEPFVGIDVENEAHLVQQLKLLAEVGKTILIVHHDLNKTADYFDEIVLINKRVIAAGSIEQTFTEENIAETYGIFIPTKQ